MTLAWNIPDAGSCDKRLLRRAFGAYGTGVAVIGTAARSGTLIGMTVNSFASVSLSPPLVMFCPSKSLAAYEVYRDAAYFSINILCREQLATAERFARSGADKWEAADYRLTENRVPVLVRALASLECRAYARHDAGDHLIVLGEVLRFRMDEDEAAGPLLFYSSRCISLPQSGERPACPRLSHEETI